MYNSNSVPFTMPVQPSCGGNGFGNFGDGWFIIILFALIFGWGNNGWGGYGSGGIQENYVLTSDFSQLSRQMDSGFASQERKLDSITNGICSLGYDQLAQINGINTNIMQGTNTLQGAIKDCCCQTQQNLADVKYTIGSTGAMIDRSVADGFCKTNFNNQTNTRDIIDSQSAGTRAILDKLCEMENSRKDEKIAEQACLINNQYLLSQINKTPVPAYVVQNPYCNCQCGQNFYGTTIA